MLKEQETQNHFSLVPMHPYSPSLPLSTHPHPQWEAKTAAINTQPAHQRNNNLH